jgi:hypothetical protein
MAKNLFNFCDLLCKYAAIPREEGVDGSGSCRTFIALYCTKKKSLVHKNLPCKDKRPKTIGKTSGKVKGKR